MTPDAPFQVGSVTKMFTAVVVMQLVQEGDLGLDDQVTDHLPGLDLADGVQVRHLLDHTSGLPEHVSLVLIQEVLGDPDRIWSPDDVLALVADEAPTSAPGERQSYSNTNYVVLGMLVEAVTGRPVADEITERIIEPLNLTGTGFLPDGPTPVSGFSPYFTGGSTETFSYAGVASLAGAAGGLVSTAGDLVTFLRAHAAGELVTPETLETMVEPDPSHTVGLGLGLRPRGDTVAEGFGHGGEIPGYRTETLVVPAVDDVVVVLTNDDELALPTLERVLAAW